ncbi:MAG: PilN domain-containing protein [Thermomonas sp.]|uniref:PilN domain-containing protein n=1 Tax=Thermomonas sp. TaxID=1971895 RepID=UPI0039E48656
MSATSARIARLAQSGASLRGFPAWWAAGLAAWLPARWRRLLNARGDRLLLEPRGSELHLRREREGGLDDLATLPLPMPADATLDGLLRDGVADLPRWLVLPAGEGLRRRLPLPAAARERLRDVLGFEIERQTPFSAADALHDGRVLGLREDGQLLVELVVVPRRQFDALAAQLGGLADGLAGLDLLDAEGRSLGVNLLSPDARARRRNPWRWWNLGLAALALLALGFGMAQIVDNRRAAADALQEQVKARGTQASAVAAQRQRLEDAVTGEAYLQAQRNGRAPVVEVMEALAQRLPDDTSLERLSIEGEQLTVIGLSNQAAALVGRLEGAPQWQAPALSGALQQDPRERMDRFTLTAQLRGEGAQEAGREPR